MRISLNLVALFFALAINSAWSQVSVVDPFYAISSVQVQSVDNPLMPPIEVDMAKTDKQSIGATLATIDQIIALGEKIYDIIKKGEPVLNTNYTPMSALPMDMNRKPVDPLEMENWSMPTAKTWQVTFKNGFGMKVVDFTYTAYATYGGQYNGKGKYLTGVQIVPTDVTVQWGFSFDANVKLVTLANYGSKANPVAGMTVVLSYSVNSVVTHIQGNYSYNITGNGEITEIQ